MRKDLSVLWREDPAALLANIATPFAILALAYFALAVL